MFYIVNVDRNWAIGAAGDMLVHLKSDLKFFKEQTMGKTVLMGRKTYQSLPGQQALPGRRNIVLTRNKDFAADGFETGHSVDQVLALAATIDPDDFVIMGGANIYETFRPYCDHAIITKIHATFADPDALITNLDHLEEWEMEWRSGLIHDPQYDHERVIYRNRQVKPNPFVKRLKQSQE